MGSASASAKTSPRSRSGSSHISHSARETLARCPKSYYLRYFTEAPRRPAVWSVGGSAVHDATEEYDRAAVKAELVHMDVAKAWQRHFDAHYQKALTVEPNESKWGQGPTEPSAVWREMGAAFVQSYIDWRKRANWEIWTTPAGEPAIELDVSGRLPGCPVEIKAYIDRVMYDPTFDQYVIPDIKSGKKPPATGEQFEVYKALLEVKYGIKARMGVHFLNRRSTTGKPFDLTKVTPEAVGASFGEAWEQVQKYKASGEWPATKDGCFICDQQESCYAIGGPLAAQHDPSHPDHPDYTGLEVPPF